MDFTKLNATDIMGLLEYQGYCDAEIYSAEYVSTNKGQVKYKIKFYEDGIMNTGNVFVYIDEFGKLTADY